MPSTINSAKGSKIPLPRFVGHLFGRMSQFRTAATTAQRAPIAGLEEEEEMELQAEDEEEEYSYEECDEEEEDDDEEVDEKMTKSDGFLMVGSWKGKEGNDQEKLRGKQEQEWKNSREKMSPNSLESSGDGGLNLLEEKCRKLIAVPVHELEAEQSLALRRGNSAFWTPCPAQAFRLCRLLQDGDELPTSGKALVPVELLLEENMETGKWDSGDGKDTSLERKMVPWESLQRPSVSHLCLDMSQLSELNEPSVLECIRRRYALRLIHTYSGLFCVVVNPWQPLAGLYSAQMRAFYARGGGGGGDGGADMPPHVYSIAQSAFDGICSPTAASQSILITGESGAGKTENTKRIIEYLIDVSSSRARPHQAGQPDEAGGIDRALVAAGTALEAFGNAQTVHNDNSSRLGKFIRVHFEPGRGRLLSARIDCFLLEKSRVVSQNPGDRNFHIFYHLLADPNFLASAKAERILDGLFGGFPPRADAFRFLNQGQRGESVHAKFVDDLAGGRDTETALDQLGFTPSEKGWLRELMVACALIGQIRFGERTGLDMSFVEEPALEMEAVAQLLALRQPGRLTDALTQPSIRVGDALIRRSQPLRKTVASAQALAKCLYERVFGWLLAKCNRAIGGNSSDEKKNGGSTGKNHDDGSTFVGVLDMAGFEIMARNSFEQLCINYTNERLQQFFNEFMFVREQQEYAREGIRWEQQCYGSDLQPTIDLIEKPLGILSLLQEECIVPNGSEQSLLEKMLRRLGQSAPSVFARAKQSSRTPNNGGHFTVAHYAGPVTYNVDGWLEKNRDAVDASLLEVLANSEHPLLVQLFPTPPSASNASAAATNGSPKLRKGPAMAQASISFVYREQLAQLLDTLGRTRAHFVRCIVPNHGRVPFQLDGKLTMDQLRCNGVLEGIRICRRGYPNRLPFAQFLARYRLLQHNICHQEEEDEPREAVQRLCSALGLGPDRFQVGRTKLFCRVGLVSELEARRRHRLEQLLTGLQAQIRWWRAQLEVKRRREEWHSLVTVQRAIRRQVQLKSWPWFRLWLKVRQLIPLAAQRRRLAELEEENRQLGKKLAQWQAQAEKSQRELEDSKDRLERVEQQRTEDRRQAEELRAELRRNEELLERMERKWDEQHAKVMRLNGTLGEQARALERLEEERNGLSKELGQLRERHRTEQLERESAEAALDAAQEESVKLRANADEMLAEMSRQRTLMNRKEAELDEHRERTREQQEELADLNRALAEANDRLGELQPLVHSERSGRRKAEALAEELGQELNRLGEELDRTGAKRDAMKEQLRAREVQTRKLERKLEEKQAEMDDCLAELRRAHKRSQTELQEQLDEWRRKSLRLETENAQLRCRLEAQSSALEMANTTGHGGRQAGGGGGGGGRFGSCQTLLSDREQRDSSVDSDCGGTGPYGIHRSLTRPHATTTTSAMHYPGSLHRRRRHGLAEFEPSSATIGLGLHRSASGTASSVGNLSSAHSSSTSSSRRRAAANQQMITSLTATVDSGLLTRSPSSTSTVSGGCTGGPQYLSMAQRVDAAERRMLEKEREAHSQRQDAQMARRELEVYKQSLQESERARDSLGKQIRQLNSELEQMGRALKAEEERTQKAEFETRKQATECAALKQRLEEQREESDAGLMAERKRNAEKLDQLAHEYETRLRQLGNSQRSQEQLLERLTDAESQLDKARAQLAHMERLQRTQSAIGETWESQYRTAQQELEGIRDENAALKSRIRRQHKQIELLTQQSELSERVNELESRVGQVQDRFGGGGGGGEKSMMAMGNGSGSGGQQKCMLAEEEEEAEDDDDDDDEEGEEEVDVQVQVFTFNCNC